ncbi:MAG: FHA domain-containing serine/threonine-protein kinase [Planctomycetaceae bacterium]|nr:FHA domain-containing serine/threonine-protein kinase [Planctomycetaceae bacterium]
MFGRYAKSTFSLAADAAASHLHFLIDTSEDRVRIVDLGSTNGLVINDKHMGGKQGPAFTDFVTLKAGDTILAGACLFRLSVAEEATVYDLSTLAPPGSNIVLARSEQPRSGKVTTIIHKESATSRFTDHLTDQPKLDADGLPQVEGFTILEKIGGGGRGIVYKAVKDDTGAAAAIKMMNFNRNKSRKQRSIEMFRREIQITKQLHHPNIIRYLGDGISGGAPFLAIEYVDGGTLDELIQDAPGNKLDMPQAVPLFIQLLEAVAHMHSRSLVHRDIKPKNILLDLRRGGSLAVKLSDMGLSCRFTSQDANEFLPIISEGGTPAYMPPEQLTDLTRAIPQSDVFSSAATFYQMLTGSLLYDFKDKDQNETILEGSITPLRELRPDIPDDVADVINKGLSYQPEGRYETAQEMLDAFKEALA